MSSLSAQSLHKNERLHSKNDIDRLLSKGRFFVVDNVFRCCVLPRPADGSGAVGSGVAAGSGVAGVAVGNGSASARMMVSVPKKCFKRAVKRNLLKRRIREAYRRNKPSLPMDILFVYLPKEILSYEQIEASLIRALERAEEKLRTCAPASAAAPASVAAAVAPSASSATVVGASAAVVRASSPAASPNSGSQTGASQREVSQPEVSQNKFVAVLKWIGNAPFLLLISFYRACVSPFTPPACRFTPTCSQYAMEAFKKYGPFKGLYLTVKRILRCRPGGGSGYDPVP